jgi:hypothetical protein
VGESWNRRNVQMFHLLFATRVIKLHSLISYLL